MERVGVHGICAEEKGEVPEQMADNKQHQGDARYRDDGFFANGGEKPR